MSQKEKGEEKIERDANIPFVCTWSKSTFTIVTTNSTTQLVLSFMSLVDLFDSILDYIHQMKFDQRISWKSYQITSDINFH